MHIAHCTVHSQAFSENIRLNYFTTGGVILRGEGPISFLSLLERVTSVLEHVLWRRHWDSQRQSTYVHPCTVTLQVFTAFLHTWAVVIFWVHYRSQQWFEWGFVSIAKTVHCSNCHCSYCHSFPMHCSSSPAWFVQQCDALNWALSTWVNFIALLEVIAPTLHKFSQISILCYERLLFKLCVHVLQISSNQSLAQWSSGHQPQAYVFLWTLRIQCLPSGLDFPST